MKEKKDRTLKRRIRASVWAMFGFLITALIVTTGVAIISSELTERSSTDLHETTERVWNIRKRMMQMERDLYRAITAVDAEDIEQHLEETDAGFARLDVLLGDLDDVTGNNQIYDAGIREAQAILYTFGDLCLELYLTLR